MYKNFGAVIPAFNEAGHILQVLMNIKRYIPAGHIVVVDDGSSDETASIAGGEVVHVIRQQHNRGKGLALKTGFEYLLSIPDIEAVFTLDADGQHNPDEIPIFAEKYNMEKVDLLIGSRMAHTEGMPRIRIFTNRFTSTILSLRTGCKIEDSQSGYRLIRSSLLRRLILVTRHYDAESEILIKAGIEKAVIKSIPIQTIYAGQRSTIHPIRDTWRFFILVIRSLFW
jgi:glycosyltransferase involved in cell wall biosynthesis